MLVPILVLAVAVVMMIAEARSPGRDWPSVRGWWVRAIALNATQAGIVWVAGVLWDDWMHANRLWSVDFAGPAIGAVTGYFVMTFFYYWWHRARHEVPFLWRWMHQLHHSPQRLEIITSFYKHPFEITANAVVSSTIMYLVVGLSPEAAAGTTLLAGLAELFYHWNVKTPRWMGFVIQRPESHCVHHQEGLHHYNYGDLPLWDMLFGTFHNPQGFDANCGFGEDEHQLKAMLLGRDLQESSGPSYSGRLAALALLGVLGMTGHVFAHPIVKGLAAATAASPAPKVFTSIDGWETYSSKFALEWVDADGDHQLAITHDIYPLIQGPYNRRNVFGAVLAYGPVIAENPVTRPMYLEAAKHALCPERGAIAFRELGIATDTISVLAVVYDPLPGTPEHHPTRLVAPCDWSANP